MNQRVDVEDLLRELAPQVLGALLRRYQRQFDACEDAVQEALIDATAQWPREGVPDNPRAWLIQVASRRLIDQQRSESARRQRESAAGLRIDAQCLAEARRDRSRQVFE